MLALSNFCYFPFLGVSFSNILVFYSYNGTTQRFGSSLFLFHIYNYSTKLRKLALRKTHIKLLSRAFYHTNYFA